MKKHDADDGHDGGATGKDCRNRGERTTSLEKKEKRDRAGADADTGQQGIIKTSSTEFLNDWSLKRVSKPFPAQEHTSCSILQAN